MLAAFWTAGGPGGVFLRWFEGAEAVVQQQVVDDLQTAGQHQRRVHQQRMGQQQPDQGCSLCKISISISIIILSNYQENHFILLQVIKPWSP